MEIVAVAGNAGVTFRIGELYAWMLIEGREGSGGGVANVWRTTIAIDLWNWNFCHKIILPNSWMNRAFCQGIECSDQLELHLWYWIWCKCEGVRCMMWKDTNVQREHEHHVSENSAEIHPVPVVSLYLIFSRRMQIVWWTNDLLINRRSLMWCSAVVLNYDGEKWEVRRQAAPQVNRTTDKNFKRGKAYIIFFIVNINRKAFFKARIRRT